MLCFILFLSACVCISNGDCDYCKCIGNAVGMGTVTTGTGWDGDKKCPRAALYSEVGVCIYMYKIFCTKLPIYHSTIM